jgi:hypothetical protein
MYLCIYVSMCVYLCLYGYTHVRTNVNVCIVCVCVCVCALTQIQAIELHTRIPHKQADLMKNKLFIIVATKVKSIRPTHQLVGLQ